VIEPPGRHPVTAHKRRQPGAEITADLLDAPLRLDLDEQVFDFAALVRGEIALTEIGALPDLLHLSHKLTRAFDMAHRLVTPSGGCNADAA
jgi:hypothetical protein